MKRLLSLSQGIGGEFSTQPVGHSSRMMTRHLPVAGSAAANSRMFWRRLVRLKRSSLPSGDQDTW